MADTSRSPLVERFRSRRAAARNAARDKNRIKTSIFIDADVLNRADRAWRDFNHRDYPKEVMKAVFLEELLEHGLRNLDAVEDAVRRERREEEPPPQSPVPSVPSTPDAPPAPDAS